VIVSPRERRPRLVALGSVLLVVVAVTIGARTVWWLERIDWQAKKPVMWLTYSAGTSDAAASDAALDELIRRAEQQALSDETLRGLAQRGLDLQADPDAEWSPRWGTLIGRAHDRQLLSAQQRTAFLERAVEYAMILLPPRGGYSTPGLSYAQRTAADREQEQRRLGQVAEPLRAPRYECIDVEFAVRSARPGHEVRLIVEARPLHLTIGPWTCLSLPAEGFTTVTYAYRVRRANPPRTRRVLTLPVIVEPGEHELRTKWEVRVRFEDDPPESALALQLHLTAPLIVEDPVEGAVPIVTDEESTRVLRAAFEVQAVGIRSHQFPDRTEPVSVIHLSFDTGPHQRLRPDEPLAPFNGALSITLSSGGRELSRFGPHLPSGTWMFIVPDESIASLDLLARHSQSGRSVFVGEGLGFGGTKPQPIWMGPSFEIKDIPVQWCDTVSDAPLTDEQRAIFRLPGPR